MFPTHERHCARSPGESACTQCLTAAFGELINSLIDLSERVLSVLQTAGLLYLFNDIGQSQTVCWEHPAVPATRKRPHKCLLQPSLTQVNILYHSYLCIKTVLMPRARAIAQACWPPAPPKQANTCWEVSWPLAWKDSWFYIQFNIIPFTRFGTQQYLCQSSDWATHGLVRYTKESHGNLLHTHCHVVPVCTRLWKKMQHKWREAARKCDPVVYSAVNISACDLVEDRKRLISWASSWKCFMVSSKESGSFSPGPKILGKKEGRRRPRARLASVTVRGPPGKPIKGND